MNSDGIQKVLVGDHDAHHSRSWGPVLSSCRGNSGADSKILIVIIE